MQPLFYIYSVVWEAVYIMFESVLGCRELYYHAVWAALIRCLISNATTQNHTCCILADRKEIEIVCLRWPDTIVLGAVLHWDYYVLCLSLSF